MLRKFIGFHLFFESEFIFVDLLPSRAFHGIDTTEKSIFNKKNAEIFQVIADYQNLKSEFLRKNIIFFITKLIT